MTRDTSPEITIEDAEVELIDDQTQYCWCCGYPSDDLHHMKLENGQRQKVECIVCDVCLDAPWVLDSWLNPWLYSNDACVTLQTMSYMNNRLIDEIRNRR